MIDGDTAVLLRSDDGFVLPLAVERWRRDVDDAEAALLATVADPVLDIGCGPGRLTVALARAGRLAMGIDPSPTVAGEAIERGAAVLQRSVFGPLPGEGRWRTALLIDGNIGIGGDPVALLQRVRDLLQPGGEVVAEVEPPGTTTTARTVRVEIGAEIGPWFPWATVGADDWPGLATQAGLVATGFDVAGPRWFARAVRP